MRFVYSTLILCGAVLGLAACAGSPIKQLEGQERYTQLNLWVEGGEHLTTNYKAGWKLPVNSKVRIGDTSGDAIKVRVPDSGREFVVMNVEGYSGQDIAGIADRYFADEARDLSGFSASDQESIREGEIRRGMSKQAVLTSRGYPPAHETGSIREDEWKYWTSRFDTIVVSFENDRVIRIVD